MNLLLLRSLIPAPIMRLRIAPAALVLLAPVVLAWGSTQQSVAAAPSPPPSAPSARFDGAATDLDRRLQDAIADLARLREEIAADVVPRSRALAQLEDQLAQVRAEYQAAARLADTRTLEVSNLTREIKARREEVSYLSNLLSEYARSFEARLHIAELHRHEQAIADVRQVADRVGPGAIGASGPGGDGASAGDSADTLAGFETQIGLVVQSIDRIDDALGGVRFEGAVVDPEGTVRRGRFLMVGPAAIFRSDDGAHVGTAEQRLGSLEPALIPFHDPLDLAAASALVEAGSGELPFDPTLGSAHRIAATEETLWEHIQAGGPVMVPIFALAGAALLVALYKFLRLLFIRRPSKRALRDVMRAIAEHDQAAAARSARKVGGPTGRMVMAGIEHLGRSRDLIEEVMYEVVLQTRLRLQRMLPFIAICAAAAPLLGLLGTVTGIITTFNLITIFGSGDVKTLSGGISQALITTEYGLIVAIPALLLHALLSRKAKGVTDQMEIVAMQVMNQISRSSTPEPAAPPASPASPAPGRGTVDGSVVQLDGRAVGAGGGSNPGPTSPGRPPAKPAGEPKHGADRAPIVGGDAVPADEQDQDPQPVTGGASAAR